MSTFKAAEEDEDGNLIDENGNILVKAEDRDDLDETVKEQTRNRNIAKDFIPLLDGFDKRKKNAVSILKLIKLDKPGAGYKGQLPLNSTEETIYQMHGNGLYNVEGYNHKSEKITSRENIRISIEENVKGDNEKTVPTVSHGDSDRIERLALHAARDAKENNDKFTQLVVTQTQSAAAREREHMQAVTLQMQTFFASMMNMQQQMLQQTVTMLQTGHQMTIESLKTSLLDVHKDPMERVELFIKAMQMGRELGDDNSPDWLKALDKGGSMLGNLVTLATTKNTPKPPAAPPPVPTPRKIAPKTPVAVKNSDKPKIFTEEELKELILLKQALNAQDIDFSAMVRQAREHYVESESEEIESDDNSESSVEGSADSEPSGSAQSTVETG